MRMWDDGDHADDVVETQVDLIRADRELGREYVVAGWLMRVEGHEPGREYQPETMVLRIVGVNTPQAGSRVRLAASTWADLCQQGLVWDA